MNWLKRTGWIKQSGKICWHEIAVDIIVVLFVGSMIYMGVTYG